MTDTTYLPDSYLASVLNEKREVKIGNDTIFKFGSDYNFAYLQADTALITEFYNDVLSNQVNVRESEIYVYKSKLKVTKTIKLILNDTTILAAKNARLSIEGVGGNSQFNDNERVSAQVWSINHVFYSYCGIKTYGERKVRERYWLFWTRESWKADNALNELYYYLKCNADQGVSQYVSGNKVNETYGSGFNLELEGKAYNTSNLEKRITQMYGFGVATFYLRNINSSHYGIKNGVKKKVNVTGNLP